MKSPCLHSLLTLCVCLRVFLWNLLRVIPSVILRIWYECILRWLLHKKWEWDDGHGINTSTVFFSYLERHNDFDFLHRHLNSIRFLQQQLWSWYVFWSSCHVLFTSSLQEDVLLLGFTLVLRRIPKSLGVIMIWGSLSLPSPLLWLSWGAQRKTNAKEGESRTAGHDVCDDDSLIRRRKSVGMRSEETQRSMWNDGLLQKQDNCKWVVLLRAWKSSWGNDISFIFSLFHLRF